MHFYILLLSLLVCGVVCGSNATAAGPMVSQTGNKHNLSSVSWSRTTGMLESNTNPQRADSNSIPGKQICIFCHTPHNAQAQGPLWNRRDTSQTFARYTSATLKIKDIAQSQYAGSQPNGSSRLCLSCHDGASALGDVVWGGPITMIGGDLISGQSSFHPSTNKMKTGHHPVSFVYATGFDPKTQTGTNILSAYPDYKLPVASVPQMHTVVKLQDTLRDGRGWMQCTTCHDPHQNKGNDVETYPSTTRKIVPFWVYSTNGTASNAHNAVCAACHGSITSPAPWP